MPIARNGLNIAVFEENPMSIPHDEKMAPALLLLKSQSPDSRTVLVDALKTLEHIVTCEAIDGEFDLIATIEALPGVGLERFISNKVRPLHAVLRFEVCRVDTLVEHNHQPADQTPNCESYLFVEVDEPKFQSVFQAVTLLSATASCQVAESPCSLVVRLRGSNFDFLDKVVNEKIRCLPGVLRARQYRIIKLAEL